MRLNQLPTQTFTVEDLSALNHTVLNGVILTPYREYPLKDGDRLRFADVEVRFVFSSGAL